HCTIFTILDLIQKQNAVQFSFYFKISELSKELIMTIVDESKLFILAAGIIIDPKGRLLVVRKQNTHKYMLPGGKIDEGESPIEALMRELHEEISLTIPPTLAHFIKEYNAPAANEPGYFIRSNLIGCRRIILFNKMR